MATATTTLFGSGPEAAPFTRKRWLELRTDVWVFGPAGAIRGTVEGLLADGPSRIVGRVWDTGIPGWQEYVIGDGSEVCATFNADAAKPEDLADGEWMFADNGEMQIDVALVGSVTTVATGRDLSGASIIGAPNLKSVSGLGFAVQVKAVISGNSIVLTAYTVGGVPLTTDTGTYTVTLVGAR